MTDFVISCDTVVRLTNVLHNFQSDVDKSWNVIRIDNGLAVATDRRFMAIENIGGAAIGIFHFTPDPVLIEQCRKEAQFSSTLTITVNEALRYAVAKTSLGYVHPTNIGVWAIPAELNGWRAIVMAAKEPVKKSKGGMFWDADGISRLAASAPSGRLVFEEHIDTTRPTIIRDINDYNWLGVFNPYDSRESYSPASMPTWMVP